MSRRQHTGTLVVAVLSGALALGACAAQGSTSNDAVQEQAQALGVRAAEARQSAALTAQRLRQVHALYPTAGMEVPPADLVNAPAPDQQAGSSGASTPRTHPTLTQRYVQ